MARLRLVVNKDGALSYLSHLDFMRTILRVMRRAELPVAYSEGFNPHMKISYDSALGVGVSADKVYLDVELKEALPMEEVQQRLYKATEKSPIRFGKGMYIDKKVPKLMDACNAMTYHLTAKCTGDEADAAKEAVSRFREAKELCIERKSPKNPKNIRLIDLKEHVTDITLEDAEEKGYIQVSFVICRTEKGAVKPEEVWKALVQTCGLPAEENVYFCRRSEVYVQQGNKRQTPFEAAGDAQVN